MPKQTAGRDPLGYPKGRDRGILLAMRTDDGAGMKTTGPLPSTENAVRLGWTLGPPDYLQTDLIDEEIKAIFNADNYTFLSHEPLLAQFIKELRLLREALMMKGV